MIKKSSRVKVCVLAANTAEREVVERFFVDPTILLDLRINDIILRDTTEISYRVKAIYSGRSTSEYRETIVDAYLLRRQPLVAREVVVAQVQEVGTNAG